MAPRTLELEAQLTRASSDSSDLSALSSDPNQIEVSQVGSTKKRARKSQTDSDHGKNKKARPSVLSASGKEAGTSRAKVNGKAKGKGKAKENGNADNDESHEDGTGEISLLEAGEKTKGVYCHNCRKICDSDGYLRCTNSRISGNSKIPKPCNLTICDRDLYHRYNIKGEKIRSKAVPNGDGEEGYSWQCPCCKDHCWASSCRKKKGLEPLGDFVKAVKASGLVKLSDDIARDGKLACDLAKTGVSSKEFISENRELIKLMEDDESELSDIDGPKSTKGKGKGSAKKGYTVFVGKPEPKKDSTPKKTPKKETTTPGKNAKGTPKTGTKATPTPKKQTKADPSGSKNDKKKSRSTAAESKEKEEPKAKPKPKPKAPAKITLPEPERPVFEKIDTRLGKEEAEQRILIREYLFRFRAVLSFPERALHPVDDFERPLTEANVRLFAGAILETIRDELEESGANEDLIGQIFNFREELRYYADTARFGAIYTTLVEPLGLVLPPPIIDHKKDANNAALRAILDLDENQTAPAWATEYTAGPSRRTAASRIPPPAEVIRMLIAFAERSLATPRIRADLEPNSSENEAKKTFAALQKQEMSDWFPRKKKMEAGLVRCTTAAQTKELKEEIAHEQQEYLMRMSLLDVNLRSQLGRRDIRSGPLGVDLDGRIYYLLSHRPVEDDGRPPLGWASGLLVWGPGLPPSANTNNKVTENGLLASVERWSHFGKSAEVHKLYEWVGWQFLQAIEDTRAKLKVNPKAGKSPANPKTPSKGTPLKGANAKTPNGSAKKTPSMKQKTLMEVIIPSSKQKSELTNGVSSTAKLVNGKADEDNDDGSSTSSGLTTPPAPDMRKAELLALLNEDGYEPSVETLEERWGNLMKGLMFAKDWLKVLEWKGFGEIV